MLTVFAAQDSPTRQLTKQRALSPEPRVELDHPFVGLLGEEVWLETPHHCIGVELHHWSEARRLDEPKVAQELVAGEVAAEHGCPVYRDVGSCPRDASFCTDQRRQLFRRDQLAKAETTRDPHPSPRGVP